MGNNYYDNNGEGDNSDYSDYTTTSSPTSSSTYYYEDGSVAAKGVWNYMLGVSIFLIFWVFTLILPKGLRKQFFGANPRRYSRRRYAASEMGTTNTFSVLESVDEEEVEKRRMHDMSTAMSMGPSHASTGIISQQQQQTSRGSTASDSESGVDSIYLRPMARGTAKRDRLPPMSSSANSGTLGFSGTGMGLMRGASPLLGAGGMPPSPGHPAINRLPSAKILNETMQRLKSRGIRLVAHGVASESKRVWIKFEEDTTSLSWQTEFPRKIPNGSGDVSLVMMRGALHRIALPNILYVDVGKKTNALMKPENVGVLDTVCFSLLTQNGSLDLQANSRLERDALVSCFSMVLDEVHTQDWRSLYAESPETSMVQSSCTGSGLDQVEF